MKELVFGFMAGAVVALAFNMTDTGCKFICKVKKKMAKMCKSAEKELSKMQEEAQQKVSELSEALKE